MEKIELKVQSRERLGKEGTRKIRAEKMIPVVLYGPQVKQPYSLKVDQADFIRIRRKGGANVLVTLQADGDVNGKIAVLKDVQQHPVTGAYLHADFYEVRLDVPIRVEIPIVLTGRAHGVGEGGILEQIRREVEVRCLPDRIPDKVEVDVTPLGIGDSLHVKDIQFPEGVEFMGTSNYTIAAVVAPQEEEEVVPVEAMAEGEEGAKAEGEEAAGETPEKEGGEKKDSKADKED